MFNTLTINGNMYKFGYDMEAALFSDCTEAILEIMNGLSQTDDTMTMIKSMAGLPKKVLVMFYAGLLEDNNIDLDDAKELLKAYMRENEYDFFAVMNMCMEQMTDDGFFQKIGLAEKKEPKKPTDHKKKTTTKTSTTKKVTEVQ